MIESEVRERHQPILSQGRRLSARSWPDIAREYGIIVLFIVLFAILSAVAPNFLSTRNLLNILSNNATVGIISLGMTLVIISGGFDLSVGAVFALAGVAAAWLALHLGTPLGLSLGMLLGALLGTLNGAIILGFRVHSFLATLASQIVFRAVAVMITGGFYLEVADPHFDVLGRQGIGEVGYQTIIWLVAAAVLWFVLARTSFGRYVYAVGGNLEAARLSGVRINFVRIMTFAICGFTAAIAGVLATSQISQGDSGQGVGLELQAIAAVVLGGTSILGGVGAIWRTILGVGILALIHNGFNLMSTPQYFQDMATGGLILLAIAVNAWGTRSKH
jgi:ribose transport system permease protein